MNLPQPILDPPFWVTRTSHVRLAVKDLAASREFYVEVAGLVVSAEDRDTVYLRGVEEIGHHSLVLRRSLEPASCDCIGMRVRTEEDLERAKRTYESWGLKAAWIERSHQGRTLITHDVAGIPLELCASMPSMPRILLEPQKQTGGRAQRMDHYQVIIPDVEAAISHYMRLGFRVSKFAKHKETGKILTAMTYRKANPHDLVLATGAGPRLHHFTYVVENLESMFRACDVAGVLGYGREVERGPGRHGPPNGLFVYFRDPDGHRMEFITPPMQMIDLDEQPSGWDSSAARVLVPWGAPPPERWARESSAFTGIDSGDPSQLGRWHSNIQ